MSNNNNSGALFKNEVRQKETDPVYRGSITIEGTEYWLASWINKDKNGQTYMSLKATPKAAAQSPVTTPTVADPVDDLPF
jgi:hypothetical protein